jgi:acyl-CoA reductase-like NAD-dependent aldehyde dehydrogenase/nicotinamidase-related amidase
MNNVALLLIDLQRDFLDRVDLDPPAGLLTAAIASFLAAARGRGVPIIHVQTLVAASGVDRMPHWVAADYQGCIEGTAGAQPPEALAPLAGETLIRKRFFSAFGDPALAPLLQSLQIRTLILAGVHLHGCVRATAFDAYERGYQVWIGEELTGTYDQFQAAAARAYLAGRAAELLPVELLLERLGIGTAAHRGTREALPAACIDHRWITASSGEFTLHRDPCRTDQVLAEVAHADKSQVLRAVAAATRSQGPWARLDVGRRLERLARLAQILEGRRATFEQLLVSEIGKPLRDAREEVSRGLRHLSAVRELPLETPISDRVSVRYRPVGTMALITPWNNPFAIPLSKLAPALLFGNGVVWKPALQAPRLSVALMDALIEAEMPAGLTNLVFGNGRTAGELIDSPQIDRVALTGSVASGRAVAARCALHGKPLQGELGGNNGMIVLEDAQLEGQMPSLAAAAFSFAGQRCTAIRRFIVARTRYAEFQERMVAAIDALKVAEPADEACDLGPLISTASLARVERSCEQAKHEGARALRGARRVSGRERGSWYEPTLLADVQADAAIAQQETFGPVAVLLPAADFDEALMLLNGVDQGLVAALLSDDPAMHARFASEAQAGILNLTPGPLPVHPDAPFGGWKASGLGPPEHGIWDREFYTRAQALYHTGPNR